MISYAAYYCSLSSADTFNLNRPKNFDLWKRINPFPDDKKVDHFQIESIWNLVGNRENAG